MLACVKREIAMRERVYPRRIAAGHMGQAMACRESPADARRAQDARAPQGGGRLMAWLAAWFAWFPVVLDQPHLLPLWLAIGWWFLPEQNHA